MSAYQSNSSLARTRSLRTTTKSTLTAPQSSTQPISKQPQIPTCTSNVLLFLTNSRLLDLDLQPDWPDITPTTFSSKDALGGQKKRIQCVEWALYQLFSLWDHNDTQNKLRPFYPPADQVQSINLRAALVRSLEAAKKNGVLGRDVLIRKTMLDECKGERLEEVLAVFSSAVLKKLVAERALNSGPEYRPTISESISLENWGYTGDRTELNGLLLAHKASLRSILKKKRAARERYHDFAELLAMKERGISRRREQAKHTARDRPIGISDTERAEVRRILRNNWTGNEQWVDGLLGGSPSQKRGLLITPFDDVWSGVQAGNITDLEGHSAGLLEQLEQRVDHQKSRLQKWEEFRRSNFGDIRPRVARDSPSKESKDESGLDFTAHLNLNFDNLTTSSNVKFDGPPVEYAEMFERLTTELEGFKSTKIPDFSSLISSSRRGPARTASVQFVPQESVSDPVSDLSDWEDEPEEVISQPRIGASSTNGNARPTTIPRGPTGSRKQLPVPRENRKTSPVHHEDPVDFPREYRRSRKDSCPTQAGHKPKAMEVDEFKFSISYEESRTPSLPNQPQSARDMNNLLSPPSRPKSPTQVLADEILNSMNNASPSPMKKSRYTLSLAERTRMSMTRTTASFEPEDETPQHSPVKASHTQANDEVYTNNHPERGEEYEDLITRTRRSMAGFEAARQKAQLERRRSQKKSKIAQRKDSYFPTVDEETVGNLSVVEGLMEDGQDVSNFLNHFLLFSRLLERKSSLWTKSTF
ncbi:HAUS augmin-like complex subunit 6 N-terminus-domain-containing protein [Xylaria sp. FL1777]|nr:HAUS augmin-like complex subunit 6 N-terminus-domain-containing protein [Xylaria sp. FL1777]